MYVENKVIGIEYIFNSGLEIVLKVVLEIEEINQSGNFDNLTFLEEKDLDNVTIKENHKYKEKNLKKAEVKVALHQALHQEDLILIRKGNKIIII